jgi:chondroitin AC lyase
MKRIEQILKSLIPAVIIYLLSLSDALSNTNWSQLESKIKQDIIAIVPELPEARVEWNKETFEKQRSQLKKNGKFKHLEYKNQDKSQYAGNKQLGIIRSWSTVYQAKGHYLYQNKRLLDQIQTALKFYLSRSWKHYNWWFNEIGIPRDAYKVYFLLKDKLSQKHRNKLIALIKQSAPFSGRTGQNLVWYSEIFVAWGVALQDSNRLNSGINNIRRSLKMIDQRDGLQSDGSFYQHGAVLYNGGYGLYYTLDLARFIGITDNTPFAFSKSETDQIVDFILDTQVWLTKGATLNYSTMGRNYARPGNSSKALARACRAISEIDHPRVQELKVCADRLIRDIPLSLNGSRHLYKGDFLIHQNDYHAFSVKMYSERLINNDTTPQHEGVLNQYMSDGVTFLLDSKGKGYRDLFPLLDYRKLPGTTETSQTLPAKPDQRQFGDTRFVGGLSQGQYALATMDFKRGHLIYSSHYTNPTRMDYRKSSLTARKSWFFTPQGLIALGADIQYKVGRGETKHSLFTTLNQTWSRGETRFQVRGQSPSSIQEDNSIQGAIDWAHHGEFLYLPLGKNDPLVIENKRTTGSWGRISRMRGNDPIEGDVLTLWFDHGKENKTKKYAYAVLSNVTSNQIELKKQNFDWRILANNHNLQAVESNLHQSFMMSAFTSASLNTNLIGPLSIDQAAVLALKKRSDGRIQINIGSPDQKRKTVTLLLTGEYDCDHCSVANGKTLIKIKLADKMTAAKGVEIQLEKINL